MVQKKELNMDDARIQAILDALKGLEYGSIQITVHDSQITQIERTEKQRFSLERKQSAAKNRFVGL
ncbi:YezD family protein [Thermoflavimicrobium dichotomicum]|uniref:DUF2292 domain-containing protein n=1 Tax=Thermoflavimicrobium dichotomicum TaxID=46223 RepID=A0A1I3RTL7_9BACL|nr:YezD family protein [Thermoflavimicrobium dichotomicum]SFJ49232.1 hypothetical protein SAMN05421852_1115 [Thermoflavimicrobium dichotomicum]